MLSYEFSRDFNFSIITYEGKPICIDFIAAEIIFSSLKYLFDKLLI